MPELAFFIAKVLCKASVRNLMESELPKDLELQL